jgi:hypothetical protein
MTPIEFIEGLLRQFKAQAQDENIQRDELFADYLEAVEEGAFSPTVLARAYRSILRGHLTPWLPKVAECLRYCQDAKDAEAWERQRSDPPPDTGPAGVERRPDGGIATTVAFTRKIHLACGKTENAEKFKFVWAIVKERYAGLSMAKLETRLIAAARFLSKGHTPREAVEKAFTEEAGEGARKMGGDPWSSERIEEADRLIQSDLGRQAAQEGWIVALHDYCRENRELPGIDRAAKLRKAAFERIAQREEWALAGRFPKIIEPVARAMAAKQARLTRIAEAA